MAERIRRRRNSQQDRERIVRAFEKPDEDYLKMADTLRINRSIQPGKSLLGTFASPRGGRNNVKVDEEM